MTLNAPRADRLSLLTVVIAAAYFAIGLLYLRSTAPNAVGSNDTYMYFYPNLVQGLRALQTGDGFLWNPYQDCGQPLFAISQTGLLYPVNWIAAVLDREPALIFTIIANLSIGGAGIFLLGRTLGLAPAAALSAALAFQLGGCTMDLAAWSPIHIGTYAWLPVVMWRTEHLVRAPGLRSAAAVALALTLQILPGFPQILFFTYQLVALRVAWAVAMPPTSDRMRLVASTVAALVLPLGLAAVQLIPSLEVARASLRTIPLLPAELGGFTWSWTAVRTLGSMELLPLALAALALVGRSRVARSTVVFYAAVTALYCGLSLGPGTPLFDLYARLPMGNAFRSSARLLWVVGFTLAVLAGIGVQTLLDRRGQGLQQAVRAIVCVLGIGLLVYWFTDGGVTRVTALLAAAFLLAATAGAGWSWVPLHVLLPVLIAIHGIAVSPKPFFGLRSGDLYHPHAAAFDAIKQRLTAQDRVLIFGRPGDYALMPKSATVFGVPDIFDYEPQATRSYAEFFTYMRTGHGIQQLDDWYWIFRRLLPATLQPPLFDLTAARYVLVDRSRDPVPPELRGRFTPLIERGDVRIYENPSARPRAFYVPRVVVMPAEDILPALTAGTIDLTRVAAVSAAPRSGFLGSDPGATGSADIVVSSAERLVVRVRTNAPGFLFVADQIFPGWQVQVNGQDRELLRANYTFRLVEVPAGESEVVFTYRPATLWIGAIVSMLTAIVLTGALRRRG